MFIKRLKLEILERPIMFCKPLIAIVKIVVALGDFDEAKIRLFRYIYIKYSFEVIGGNHRGEAFAHLEKEGKLGNSSVFSMKVHLLQVDMVDIVRHYFSPIYVALKIVSRL